MLCAATKRQHRGKVQKLENSVLRAMRQRGALSHVARQQAEELIEALKHNNRPKHPYLKKALQTRGIIIEEYGQITKALYKMWHKTEARIIGKLAKEVAWQSFNTQAQDKFDRFAGNTRAVEQLQQQNQSELDVW